MLNAEYVLRAYIDSGVVWPQASLGVKVEQKVLDRLVQKKLPKVYQHFKTKLECEPSSVATAWFSTLFAGVLPAPVSCRCWPSRHCGPAVAPLRGGANTHVPYHLCFQCALGAALDCLLPLCNRNSDALHTQLLLLCCWQSTVA
jgi:hypothetical protein